MTHLLLGIVAHFRSLLRLAGAVIRGDALVDLRLLPDNVVAPLRPYLHSSSYTNAPLWQRRFQFAEIDLHIRIAGRHRFAQTELEVMYEQHTRLLSATERAARNEIAAVEAQNDRDLLWAKADFLASLIPEERALLDARLRAKAEDNAHVETLAQQNGELWRQVETLTAQLHLLKDLNRQLDGRKVAGKGTAVGLLPRSTDRKRDARGRFLKETSHG